MKSAIGLAREVEPVRGCEHPAYESKVRSSPSEQKSRKRCRLDHSPLGEAEDALADNIVLNLIRPRRDSAAASTQHSV
jgi:hypothetical protein